MLAFILLGLPFEETSKEINGNLRTVYELSNRIIVRDQYHPNWIIFIDSNTKLTYEGKKTTLKELRENSFQYDRSVKVVHNGSIRMRRRSMEVIGIEVDIK